MKVYVDNRKTGTKDTGFKAQYGMTIYSDTGQVLHSSVYYDELSNNKFENTLKALDWAVKKYKVLAQNKVLPEESTVLIIGSKTLYGWFENEVAPEPYTVLFSDILMEMSFIHNPLEIILSGSASKRVLYRESNEDKGFKASDLLQAVKK